MAVRAERARECAATAAGVASVTNASVTTPVFQPRVRFMNCHSVSMRGLSRPFSGVLSTDTFSALLACFMPVT
jgi:hypothetical protein